MHHVDRWDHSIIQAPRGEHRKFFIASEEDRQGSFAQREIALEREKLALLVEQDVTLLFQLDAGRSPGVDEKRDECQKLLGSSYILFRRLDAILQGQEVEELPGQLGLQSQPHPSIVSMLRDQVELGHSVRCRASPPEIDFVAGQESRACIAGRIFSVDFGPDPCEGAVEARPVRGALQADQRPASQHLLLGNLQVVVLRFELREECLELRHLETPPPVQLGFLDQARRTAFRGRSEIVGQHPRCGNRSRRVVRQSLDAARRENDDG